MRKQTAWVLFISAAALVLSCSAGTPDAPNANGTAGAGADSAPPKEAEDIYGPSKPAMAWLARHQEADGHWDCKAHGGGKSVRPEVTDGFDESATALALIAFATCKQDSVTPHPGSPYAETCRKGLSWLMKRQKPDGSWANDNRTNAICSLAVAEFGGSSPEGLKETIEKAMKFLLSQQAERGGWGYGKPGTRSDVVVTAWVLRAFASVSLYRTFSIPADRIERAKKFLESAGAGKETAVVPAVGASGPEKDPDPRADRMPTVAAAGCLRQDMAHKTWVEKISDEVKAKGPVPENMQDAFWAFHLLYTGSYLPVGRVPSYERMIAWRTALWRSLRERQVKGGEDDGSWDPAKDRYGAEGGRVYTTALGAASAALYD